MQNPTSTQPQAIVRVEKLVASYGDRAVLEETSMSVRPGEIFVIMGTSGSGKTTLLRHMLGLQRPLSGEVNLLGQSLSRIGKRRLYELRKRVGVAFQGGALINSMSVIDNVELPLLQHTKLDRSTIRIMSRMKLEMMNLGGCEDLMPAQLSGGMLKRAGLARAVIMDPPVLFFDEPSAGLDPVTAADLDELIMRLREVLKITIVIVTHALESALKVADRVMILADGKALAIGTVAEIQANPDPRIQGLLHRRANSTAVNADEYLDRLTAPQRAK
jgi:phospholipid/cholesterol/gamma-HCH transport system ATP-binding protein